MSTTSTETEALLGWLADEQAARCTYGTREGDGRTCDCKFGVPVFGFGGERTGCPELRAAIWTLRAALPAPEPTP
jgi:hypothetical protein